MSNSAVAKSLTKAVSNRSRPAQ